MVSPKLDGIRAIVKDGMVMSRTLKPIPNKHVQKLFSHLEGLDGELIVGDVINTGVFCKTSSGVMSIEGEPDVKFYVFDDYRYPDLPFINRFDIVSKRISKTKDVILVAHLICKNEQELRDLEAKWVKTGFEGMMIRDPNGPYKYGRSTNKEGWLLKLKRFEDSEAIVIDVKPMLSNENPIEVDQLGHAKRSHKKAGMIVRELLGSLVVKDLTTGVEFEIGSGFSEDQRKELWRSPPYGLAIKYKYQPAGVKDKPRFPVFIGIRNEIDL
jgi:DNA ligase-1